MNRDPRRLQRTSIIRVAVLFALLGCGAGEALSANEKELPTDFYIVSMVTSDASPFWYYYVLDVRAAGPDSIVRYIRIAPMDSMCSNAITVKAATARLAGVTPSDLSPNENLCAVDGKSINRELQQRTRTAAIDDSIRFGIVATCGSRVVTLHLPFPEQVGLKGLRKSKPQLARLWDLPNSVKERAFGPGQVFYDTSVEQEERLHREGQAVVPELLSGRFDAGFQTLCPAAQRCESPAFRDQLHQYVGPVGESGYSPKFVQAEKYHFSRYVAPKYPALAMQARIQGTVKLELSVDTDSGEVRDIKVRSGHPLFLSAVKDAVSQWRFVPEELHGKSEHLPAEFVFEWTCPKPLPR